MNRKIYQSSRLVLRPLEKEDYCEWYDFYVNPGTPISRFDLDPMPPEKNSPDIFESIIEKHISLANKDETYVWFGFEKSSGKMVGHIDISPVIRREFQLGFFGYRVRRHFCQRGFATEMGSMAIQIGFSDLELHRLEAHISLENEISMKTAKALGMDFEGVRKRFQLEDFGWEDQAVFSAIKD